MFNGIELSGNYFVTDEKLNIIFHILKYINFIGNILTFIFWTQLYMP